MSQRAAQWGSFQAINGQKVGRVAIIGSGPAGLLAAIALKALANSIDVFDDGRNNSPDSQMANQGHAILAGGIEALNSLDPLIVSALKDRGAVEADPFHQILFIEDGITTPRTKSKYKMLTCSRALIDRSLISIATASQNIRFINTKILSVAYRDTTKTFSLAGNTDQIFGPFDIVIDASGRGKAAIGRRAVDRFLIEKAVKIPVQMYQPDIKLLSAIVKLPTNVDPISTMILENSRPPNGNIGGQLMLLEKRQIQVGFAQRAASKDVPLNFNQGLSALRNKAFILAIQNFELVREEHGYHFKEAYVRRFDQSQNIPPGLISIGDSYMSTNPVYGMGVSLAAIAAMTLKETLSENTALDCSFSRRYYSSIWQNVKMGWNITEMTDSLYYGNDAGSLFARAVNFFTQNQRWRFLSDTKLSIKILRSANLLSEIDSPFDVSNFLGAITRSFLKKRPREKRFDYI